MSLPLAVLISGSGSNLQSLIDSIEAGRLKARIETVVSNTADAYGLQRAERYGLRTQVLPHGDYPSREEYDRELVRAIKLAGAGAVVLAGFMRILSPEFIHAFEGRIVNIHPALLPAFPGINAQKQAREYAVKLSGCSVHFVDEKMDHGPVIIQAAVPCYSEDDTDSLQKRILSFEHRIYPQAVHWLAEDRLRIRGREVRVLEAPAPGIYCGEKGSALINPGLEPGF
ncbi:MAG: phosphoribosylglycinamide formyltransferase [Desulfonatronovibrionaceae bacterium]